MKRLHTGPGRPAVRGQTSTLRANSTRGPMAVKEVSGCGRRHHKPKPGRRDNPHIIYNTYRRRGPKAWHVDIGAAGTGTYSVPAGQHLTDGCGPGPPCHEGVRMAPDAHHGPIGPREIISALKGTCMSSDLVLLRCSPEPELSVARLCRSANDPAKSPPFSPLPPPHGGFDPDGVREKIASGPAGRNGESSTITTLCSRPVCLWPILILKIGRWQTAGQANR